MPGKPCLCQYFYPILYYYCLLFVYCYCITLYTVGCLKHNYSFIHCINIKISSSILFAQFFSVIFQKHSSRICTYFSRITTRVSVQIFGNYFVCFAMIAVVDRSVIFDRNSNACMAIVNKWVQQEADTVLDFLIRYNMTFRDPIHHDSVRTQQIT